MTAYDFQFNYATWVKDKNGIQLMINPFGWKGVEYLVRPNEEGFDLIGGEVVQYSFTRIP